MKKFIAGILCFSATLSLFSGMAMAVAPATDPTPTKVENAFSDVPQTNGNYVAIKYLKDKGILGGYADGSFKPANLVNRAEALKILLVANKVQVPEKVETSSFSDVKAADWYAKYLEIAKTQGIVKGNPDGTFAPARNVSRAEFLKMLLVLNSFKTDKWVDKSMFADVPKDAWFTPYMNYAGQAGLLVKDVKNNLYPALELTRGDVAEIIYLMLIIRNDKNTQFLMDQTEAQMAQIEVYVGDNNPLAAKRASELAVDFSQQAYTVMPENNVVLGAAKLAKAYNFLMNSYISAIKKDYVSTKSWADQAIAKATEAWEANNDIQAIAKHVKDRAAEIIAQIPKDAVTTAPATATTTK